MFLITVRDASADPNASVHQHTGRAWGFRGHRNDRSCERMDRFHARPPLSNAPAAMRENRNAASGGLGRLRSPM